MKKSDDICVVIQARLGSQRIPKKMIKPFCNSTLTDIAIEKIKKCSSFSMNSFYLSVYESELIQIGKNHNINIFYRSKKSANSEGTPMTEMYEWWNKLPYKYCVLINACAPFLKPKTIDKFIEAYKNSDMDGMFGVIEKKNYFWNQKGNIITPLIESVMNTKTVDITYEAAHCLYAGRMNKIGESIWMGDFNSPGQIELFPLSEKESLDIDYKWQFNFCESAYKDFIGNGDKINEKD